MRGRYRKGKKAWRIVDGLRMASARQWKFAIRYGKFLDRIAAEKREAKITLMSSIVAANAAIQFALIRSKPILEPWEHVERALAVVQLSIDTARAIANIRTDVEREELLSDLPF